MNCIICNKELTGRQTKFCSKKCKGIKHSKAITNKAGLNLILSSIKLGTESFSWGVSDNNLEGLSSFRWRLGTKGYIQSYPDYGNVRLHQIVWTFFKGPIPKGYQVDHINRNKLDNRLSNLRLATRSQNASNMGVKNNKKNSKYKGVQLTASGKYQACIWFNKKNHGLGSFDTEEEAALAYNKKAKEIQGEFAYQNVIK